ncbi:MAG: hypothetical protein ABSG32_30695 [Terriglobia bacterium]|jgi:hypothetical protein
MENWKEFRFKIDGEINGVKITPTTIPLARMAQYLLDLAQLLGHRESVHLTRVEEGSAQPVILIDPAEEARVTQRVRNAQRGAGPSDANSAYKKLDDRLREDNATGTIVDHSRCAEIIEFPGNKTKLPQEYGPIRESASITGELKRVGGFDKTIPIHLLRSDGVILYCEASETVAKDLAPYYSKVIRIHGIATYRRGSEGKWILEHFKIQSFDEEPLADESFSDTMERLRNIDGNEWAKMPDPLEELRKIRDGEGEVTQQ